MKRLLFVIENFNVGGVQKSLINLLNEVSTSYNIDVAAFDARGDFRNCIPNNVNIITLPRRYAVFANPISAFYKKPSLNV